MYKQLTSEQRYTISVLLQNGMKQKDIAKARLFHLKFKPTHNALTRFM